MTKQTVKYTGVTEDYFSISTDAPTGWPADEINCATSRASAVIALVVIHLKCKDQARPLDSTLSDAIWSAIGDVALISKLACHYNNEAILTAARQVDSGMSAVMMFLNEPDGQPADYILSDCLELAAAQLVEIKKLSDLEHEQQRLLSAA